ncbi:TetR/AcrR family transcriptional regulator [Pleionea sediminis]|uniref:TetR/AcrR family transcriptional regulator n=1 Tax=Pleionea sediminis TaxID=2569479 RepID=UPI001185A43C|nr:TetR/AcrR family transcriptional regulator [Pleionea sediminis]
MSTKQKIIDAGIHLFNTEGYFNVNSNVIATHAGVSVGSFYNYFEDKSELFLEIYKLWHESQRQDIFNLVLESPSDKNFTLKFVEAILPYYKSQILFRSAINILRNQSEAVREFRLEQQQKIIDAIIKLCNLRNIEKSKEEAVVFQMQIERLFDAYASNEFKDLGFKVKESKHILLNFVHQFTTGTNFED